MESSGLKWSSWYNCTECGNVWRHDWDNDEFSNDYTQCTNCESLKFEEIDEPCTDLVAYFK